MSGIRVLIVDDDTRLTRTLKLSLEATGGYAVETESLGARAVDTARRFRPHVILLDLRMPDVDGAALVPSLRDCCPGAPIVFFTGLVAKSELPSGAGCIGGQTFLAKPASPDEVMACIAALARPSGRSAPGVNGAFSSLAPCGAGPAGKTQPCTSAQS